MRLRKILISLPAAVQNERQPRSTAHVSLDSICVDTKKEHLATTRELTSSTTYSSVICRPLVTSSVTTSASVQPCSNPNKNHRFMVSLLTAETCAKLEPEDGESRRKSSSQFCYVEGTRSCRIFSSGVKQYCCVSSLNICDSGFSGGEY